mgnify:CR=1 FL=1
MRIAFYAPMKSPDHPLPSGDRQVGRLLMEALTRGGHDVSLASQFRSWDGKAMQQAALKKAGTEESEALIESFKMLPHAQRPDVWFTYHLYYKAPDWIGPAVARAMGIPYVVAEASVAYKRAGGPWDIGHRQVLDALAAASAVVTLNPGDAECLPLPEKSRLLPPFLDPAPYEEAASRGRARRQGLAASLGLDPDMPWLLSVAMMREGDKLESYRVLSAALAQLPDLTWALLVAGNGPASETVRGLFEAFPADRIRFLGTLGPRQLTTFYGACDLLVWPAVREAYGMALLEAQASGLPVLAGRSPGVESIVASGETAVLVDVGSVPAFAEALAALL